MNPGDIEFLSKGAAGEPLVYMRSCEGERILVALNPTETDHRLEDSHLKELLYVLGDAPERAADHVILKKESAFFALL